VAETLFIDAKFFEENVVPTETAPAVIFSISERIAKNDKDTHTPPKTTMMVK